MDKTGGRREGHGGLSLDGKDGRKRNERRRLLRLDLALYGQGAPTLAIGGLSAHDDDESPGIVVTDAMFHHIRLLFTDDEEEHLLFLFRIQPRCLDAGGGAVEVVEDEVPDIIDIAFRDDENHLVLLPPIEHQRYHPRGDVYGNDAVNAQQDTPRRIGSVADAETYDEESGSHHRSIANEYGV